MAESYNLTDIDFATVDPSFSTGHEAYIGVLHKPTNKKIIYKKNKFRKAEYSRLEVSFGQLAKLLLAPNLTSDTHLVIEDNKITGLAVEHLCYSVKQQEGLEKPFYSLDPNFKIGKEQPVEDETKIPIYFLDKLPQGHFAQLIEAEKSGNLTIDYNSLASILASSYTMEEDDLHKGNFGFYVIKKNNKPHVVFFKIDHDLMLVDSIMSFRTRRFFHLFQDFRAFKITAEDLIFFPNIKDSINFYWPTKFSYFANPFNNKEYRNVEEIKAFANLATNPKFIRAKWSAFYKHILTPPELIKRRLEECSEGKSDLDRAHVALLTQAMVARLAALRALLFSIKEFREFVVGLTLAEKNALIGELVSEHDPLAQQINSSLERFHKLCTEPHGFEARDNPLHTAIKLGEYRYQDTMRMFGEFINQKNNSEKTPLDLALEQAERSAEAVEDVGKDNRLIMKHLLKHDAQFNLPENKTKPVPPYHYVNPYLGMLTPQLSYPKFKEVLQDIGEDHRFPLKFKKNLALECIKHWMKIREKSPNFRKELLELQKDVNRTSPPINHASIKYIGQLRSRLWIIRQIRGLYGLTSTQLAINLQIEKKTTSLNTKMHKSSPFFGKSKNQKGTQEKKPRRQPTGGI
jgi:hypothetical protein